MLARAFRHPYQPINVHLVPIRRCNLACTYCHEFDDFSKPVPTAEMLARVDRLAALGTSSVTISGGEPLLHPDLDRIVARIRKHGMLATLITNGYLLVPSRIARLNRAGLDHLQISIDNVEPDDVSKKSLKVLDAKLQALAARAAFDVTINAVLGADIRRPEDALVVARRAVALGFTITVGIIHDERGQLTPLDEHQRRILRTLQEFGRSMFDVSTHSRFQDNLAEGRANHWDCRAGSRYLYICEDGLVHWCSQQRGYPGIPLAEYTPEDLKREYATKKRCAPLCTVGCVHRVALADELRERPVEALEEWFASTPAGRPPAALRALQWAFVTGSRRELFRGAAKRLFGV